MTFTITRRKLFLKIKCKKEGLHPNIIVADPEFSEYAEEALFVLFEPVDKANISTKDSEDISKFLKDFVKKTRTYWKKRNVKSDPLIMFKKHEKYFDKIIDFGDLNPPKAAARLIKDLQNFNIEVRTEVLQLIDNLKISLYNEIQHESKPKIEVKKEMEVQRGLETIEKLRNFRLEIKRDILQWSGKLDARIENEIQFYQNEIDKHIEDEISLDLSLKNKNQVGLKSKFEVEEEMEVQRGLEIIENTDPSSKKPKLVQVSQNVDKSNTVAVVDPQNVAKKVDQEIVSNRAPDPVLEIDQLPMGTGD